MNPYQIRNSLFLTVRDCFCMRAHLALICNGGVSANAPIASCCCCERCGGRGCVANVRQGSGFQRRSIQVFGCARLSVWPEAKYQSMEGVCRTSSLDIVGALYAPGSGDRPECSLGRSFGKQVAIGWLGHCWFRFWNRFAQVGIAGGCVRSEHAKRAKSLAGPRPGCYSITSGRSWSFTGSCMLCFGSPGTCADLCAPRGLSFMRTQPRRSLVICHFALTVPLAASREALLLSTARVKVNWAVRQHVVYSRLGSFIVSRACMGCPVVCGTSGLAPANAAVVYASGLQCGQRPRRM